MFRVFANGLGDQGSVEGQVIPLKKWYLMPLCLALSIIRFGSRVKWSNLGKGVEPSPTPWCSSYWKGSLLVALDYSRQLYLLLQIFKTMEKSEFCVLIKHCFLMGKILFKQSNRLISVIQTLLCWKQWLRGGMLTLNTVVRAQMMLNAQVVQIWKTPKKFYKLALVNLKLKLREIAEVFEDIRRLCIHHFSWTFVNAKSVFKVGVTVNQNDNASTIQNIVCNCFNATKRSFRVNMWQWMKHGSTISLQSQISSQLSGQKAMFWPPYFRMRKVFVHRLP